jgi:hypothetical protein
MTSENEGYSADSKSEVYQVNTRRMGIDTSEGGLNVADDRLNALLIDRLASASVLPGATRGAMMPLGST